jgi:Rrf2 family iron-sulfur cluster assembly transcriptional regulator
MPTPHSTTKFASDLWAQIQHRVLRSLTPARARTYSLWKEYLKMRIGTKCRFAVTAMTDLALRETLGPVPLTDISLRQHISLSYLEQLFSKLRHHGLVSSVRGPGGGYSIASRAEDITLADIICAVQDAPSKVAPPGASKVHDLTQKLWDDMDARALGFARTVTLKSLVLEQLATGVKIEKAVPAKHGMHKRPDQPFNHPNAPNSVFELGRFNRAPG